MHHVQGVRPTVTTGSEWKRFNTIRFIRCLRCARCIVVLHWAQVAQLVLPLIIILCCENQQKPSIQVTETAETWFVGTNKQNSWILSTKPGQRCGNAEMENEGGALF